MDNYTNNIRSTKGFLIAKEALETIGKSNSVLDANSLLLSKDVVVGKGNVFYPNVVIERTDDGSLTIGDNNTFYPGTYILSSAGSVSIGNDNEFGPNSCTIKANAPNTTLTIGDGGRYCDGANIMGTTNLGSGSQVLGNITVQGCTLAAGGTYRTPDPDERAAVLKGFGLARGITLDKGQVVNGSGDFSKQAIEWQRSYHPKPEAK